MKNRILDQAQRTFFQCGFHRITMDRLARDLGISKKTLYQHFPGKEALLAATLRRLMDNNERVVQGILENSQWSLLEKLHRIFTHVGSILSTISPQFIEDIRRYAPQVWEIIDRRRMQLLRKYIRPLMEMGVRQGLIRKGIPPDLIFLIYTTLIQQIVNPETFSRIPLTARQVFTVVIQVIFQGTLTDKAKSKFLRIAPGKKKRNRGPVLGMG